MEVTKEFTFDSAHKLPKYDGPCGNMHGHTYKLQVTVRGEIDQIKGMVVDFVKLKDVVKKEVIDKIDHTILNDILYCPTAEFMTIWIKDVLIHSFQKDKFIISKIKLWETPTSFATWRIND